MIEFTEAGMHPAVEIGGAGRHPAAVAPNPIRAS
jgi:hypothetical protein